MSIELVLLWYLLFSLAGIPFLYLGARLASNYGSNKFIGAGHILHALSFLSILSISESGSTMIWLAALLLAATRGIYWPAYHAYFSKIKKPEKSGEQISLAMSLTLLAHGLAPAIGGIIADILGINFLYGLAAGLLVLASIPMLFGEEVTTKRKLDMKQLDYKKIKPDLLANSGASTTALVENFIWPILVFFVVGSYVAVGLLSSVALLATIATILYVGRHEKISGERHFIRQGITALELSHLLRLFAASPIAIFSVNGLFGISKALKTTPFLTKYYRHADEEPRLEYILAFEIAFQLGQLSIVTATLMLSLVVADSAALLVGIALLMPLSLLILKIR